MSKYDALNTTYPEVEERVWNFYRGNPEREVKFKKVMAEVRDACTADMKRCGEQTISRRTIKYCENAINLIPNTFKEAKIFLVDAATVDGLDQISGFSIHAKSFRSFKPIKGNRSDKNYFSLIQKSLNVENNDYYANLELVEKIMKVDIDESGMFRNTTVEFDVYSPKICLIYSNINQDNRFVFMLRPSHNNLNRVSYHAYCYMVMALLLKRANGKCNMNLWSSLDSHTRMAYAQSMIVTDSMLATRAEDVVRFPLIHKEIRMERLNLSAPYLVSAA